MSGAEPPEEVLISQARDGDPAARAVLFDRYRGKLKAMVKLRLAGRIDASDVLQDAYLDFDRRLAEYDPTFSFYL